MASHPEGEGNFNIFYQLIAGADVTLTSELMLDALPGEEPNLYVEPHEDVSIDTCVYSVCMQVYVEPHEYIVDVPEAAHFFLGKVTALGVLCCFALFVCLTLLILFFLIFL